MTQVSATLVLPQCLTQFFAQRMHLNMGSQLIDSAGMCHLHHNPAGVSEKALPGSQKTKGSERVRPIKLRIGGDCPNLVVFFQILLAATDRNWAQICLREIYCKKTPKFSLYI